MTQAFGDDVYGGGRGPAFQTRGGNRGAQDPFGGAAMPSQSPTQAPPGGRELPAGYVIPPAPGASAQQTPRPPVNPSAGARESANEQAAATMAAQADAAHKEAMAALKAAGQAKAAQQAAQNPQPSAAHVAAAAAAQVAAHAAPRQGPPPVPQSGPRMVPPLDPSKGPSVAPAAQVVGTIPLDQAYAQYCNPLDPFDPNCVQHPVGSYPPSGVYNPQAGNPSLAGNLSARTMTGSVGVGQMTGQVTAGTPFGMVGGIYRGVTQPGVYGPTYGAGQAKSSGVAPEEAWLIACKTTASGWLSMQPMQRLNCLVVAGCKPNVLGVVAAAVDTFAAKKTGHIQAAGMLPVGMQAAGMHDWIRPVEAAGMHDWIQPKGMRAAGQVVVTSGPDYTLPVLLALGAAVAGTYLYMTDEKREKKSAKKAASRRRASYRLPTPRPVSPLPPPSPPSPPPVTHAMSYPLSPDFTSAGPDVLNPPAWWGYTRDDGTLNICETTGAAVVRRIRATLGLSNIAVWDADLQNALIAKAQSFAASQPSSNWQPLIDDLNNGLRLYQTSKIAMQFGIWLAYYQQNGLRLDAISIDNSVRLPEFGLAIPDGPQGDVLVCLDPNRDVPVGNYNQSDLTSAQQQSSAGIRLRAGESMPAPQVPTPPSTGIPTSWLIGIGVGILAVTAIVVYSNSQYAKEAVSQQGPSGSRISARASARSSARPSRTSRLSRTRGVQ